MAHVEKTIQIDPTRLILTNEDINPNVVDDMVKKLKSGEIMPRDLTIPYVTFVEGKGLCVNDGNHSVRACQIAGIKQIEVDIY